MDCEVETVGAGQKGFIGGAVNLFLFYTALLKLYKNLNIQYKNDWYTFQKLTKPVFAFRHWENLVSSSIYPSWGTLKLWIYTYRVSQKTLLKVHQFNWLVGFELNTAKVSTLLAPYITLLTNAKGHIVRRDTLIIFC